MRRRSLLAAALEEMAMNGHRVCSFGILAVFTIVSVVPTSNAAAQVEIPDQVLAWTCTRTTN
jgi:hypothetical protein